MRHNVSKTNHAVMYGVMGMAVVVMLVVLLFLGWMGQSTSADEEDADSTEITTGSLEQVLPEASTNSTE